MTQNTPVRNDKRTIFGWAMYDWANSAYITIFGAVIGAFFTGTIMTGDTYWGLSGEALFAILIGLGSIALLLTMPILGAMADYANAKRRFLRNFAVVGALFTLVIAFVPDGQVPLFLIIVVISQFGFVAANVFYDGFLPEIASDDTVDQVSSKGFALGYLGGGLYLLLALVLIFLSSDEPGAALTETLAARIAIFGSGIWWIGFSLFSLSRLPADGPSESDSPGFTGYAKIGFERTLATTKKLGRFPQLLLFVIAFIIYNSGVGTVIAVSGPYAEDTLELELQTIALAFLIVQFIAFFGALMFGKLSNRVGPKAAVMASLVVWTGIAGFAYFIPTGSDTGFLALAAVVGFVLGGVQALSRSLYSSMIPEEASAEFFGFYSVFSKLSGIGPLVFGAVSAATGSGRAAILSVAAFFVVGLILLGKVNVDEARASKDQWDFDDAEPQNAWARDIMTKNAVSIAGVTISHPTGDPVILGDQIKIPTVVVIARYYGWAGCLEMLAQLAAVHPDIIESGGNVIGVAPAAPYQAVALAEGSIPFPLFMDPDRSLATRLEVGTQSMANFVFNVKGWGRYGTALLRNRKQGAVTGGYETLPAVAVVDADAIVRYLYRGTAVADYPPLTTILAELDDVIDDAN